MNQEIKKLWVNALRSGNYQQGRGVLQTADNEFCCLGVLCDLYVKAGLGEWVVYREDDEDEESDDGVLFFSGHNEEEMDLTPEVSKWADLDSRQRIPVPRKLLLGWGIGEGQIEDSCTEDPHDEDFVGLELIDANDELQLTFDQIAHIIEHYL